MRGAQQRRFSGRAFGPPLSSSLRPGGCGATEACRSCGIKRLVEACFEKGEAYEREEVVLQHHGDFGQLIEKRYVVTARPLGKWVLLRLDEAPAP